MPSRFSHVQLFVTSWTVVHQLLCLWGFSSKNTEVGYHFLLQGFFPTQGSNPSLPHCRQILYHLSHQRNSKVAQSYLTLCNLRDYTVHRILQARILEWIAFPFFRGSSQPRERTQVLHTQIVQSSVWKWTSLMAQTARASADNERDLGSIPGSGRSPGEGNGNPLQYYCLENPMDRGAW